MSAVLVSLAALLLTTGQTFGDELAIPCGHQDNCMCYNVIGLISCINKNLLVFHDDFLEVDRETAIYLDLKFNNLTRFAFQESMWPELIEVDLRENPIDCAWLSKESWREMAKTDCIIAHEEWQDLDVTSKDYEDYKSVFEDLWPMLSPENYEDSDSYDASDPDGNLTYYKDLPGGGWTPYKGRHEMSDDASSASQKHAKTVSSGELAMLIFLSAFGAIFMIVLALWGLRATLRKLRGKRQSRRSHVNTIVRDGDENGKPFVYSNMADREDID